MFVIPIISEVIGLGRTLLEGKIKEKQAVSEAKAKIIEKSVDHENKWEELMAQNSGTSWKDEYWTIVISIPLIMCFVPGLQNVALEGFAVLEKTPDWYQWAVGAAIGAAFGLRAFAKWVQK